MGPVTIGLDAAELPETGQIIIQRDRYEKTLDSSPPERVYYTPVSPIAKRLAADLLSPPVPPGAG